MIGGALVHDLVVLPLVLLVGAGFASMGRPGLARSLRWAVAVGAVLTVASFPVVARFGERSDNATVLPLPALPRRLPEGWPYNVTDRILDARAAAAADDGE